MKAPLYFPLRASWIRWSMQLRDTQQPTVSSHLIPLCLGFLTIKRKFFLAVQAGWEAQKANIRNSDRQCSSGMKNAQGRTSTRNRQDHRDVSRSRADPAWGLAAAATPTHGTQCSVMLEPETGRLPPLLHLEGDFAHPGLWHRQHREMHPKVIIKYLEFSYIVKHLLPLQQVHWGGALCLPGKDINLLQTNCPSCPSWQSDSFHWGKESRAK